jgi:hypothetical protein
MEQLKEITSILKADKIIMQELRRLVGRQAEPNTIFNLESQLQYEKAERTYEELQRNGTFALVAGKLSRVRTDIDKLRKFDFSVCQYLNSLGNGWRKKAHKETAKKEKQLERKIMLDFSGIDVFNHIQNECIPIVLSSDTVIDLTKMPHLLVAGQTGSGKSVFLNAAILSILYKMKPNECRLALVDPKRVEFAPYKGAPHLYAPVATKLDQIERMLTNLVEEMEHRYELLEQADERNIAAYNKVADKKLPYIVVVIDELADLMLVSDHGVEEQITRLAQLARAVGIHLIMATQRPVVEIMTGLIKANMPARVAFKVASKQDSRVILDEPGAEQLRGAGEMVFKYNGTTERHQGIWVSDERIKKICRRVK